MLRVTVVGEKQKILLRDAIRRETRHKNFPAVFTEEVRRFCFCLLSTQEGYGLRLTKGKDNVIFGRLPEAFYIPGQNTHICVSGEGNTDTGCSSRSNIGLSEKKQEDLLEISGIFRHTSVLGGSGVGDLAHHAPSWWNP